MKISRATSSLSVQPETAEEEATLMEQAFGASALFGENSGSMDPEVRARGEIRCPYCNVMIAGKDLVPFDLFQGDRDMVDWILPCPHCGRPIRKRDI